MEPAQGSGECEQLFDYREVNQTVYNVQDIRARENAPGTAPYSQLHKVRQTEVDQ
jgi:hypothetical protein